MSCFTESTAIDTPQSAWQEAQLRLSRGALGLRRLSGKTLHGGVLVFTKFLRLRLLISNTSTRCISHYSSLMLEPDALNVDSFLKTVCSQRTLSGKIEECQFSELYMTVFPQQARHACSLFHPPMPLPGYQLYHLWDSTCPLNLQNSTLPIKL